MPDTTAGEVVITQGEAANVFLEQVRASGIECLYLFDDPFTTIRVDVLQQCVDAFCNTPAASLPITLRGTT